MGFRYYKNTILISLILFAVIASCSRVPPFNAELSSNYLTLNKMELLAKVGPVEFETEIENDPVFHFIPDRQSNDQGFVLLLNTNDNNRVFYVNNKHATGGKGFSHSSPADWSNPIVASALVDEEGQGGFLFLLEYMSRDTEYNIYKYDPGDNTLLHQLDGMSLLNRINSDFGTEWGSNINNIHFSGASISPEAEPRLYVCISNPDGGDFRYYEYNYLLSAELGLTDAQATRSSMYMLYSTHYYDDNLYFYDTATGRGIISDYIPPDYFLRTWNNAYTASDTDNLGSQYENFLSDGTFLSITNNSLLISNLSGENITTIANWPFRFEYEMLRGDTYYSCFSYSINTANRYSAGQYAFYLYAYPTGQTPE